MYESWNTLDIKNYESNCSSLVKQNHTGLASSVITKNTLFSLKTSYITRNQCFKPTVQMNQKITKLVYLGQLAHYKLEIKFYCKYMAWSSLANKRRKQLVKIVKIRNFCISYYFRSIIFDQKSKTRS